MNDQLWWYAARATGLVGWGLCTLSVLWGLTLSTSTGSWVAWRPSS